jgi:O-antigen ligase
MISNPKFEWDALWLKLSLITLALMASVPFLITRHFQPLPSFSSEWWAAVLGLAAFALAFAQRKEFLVFPQIAIVPLALVPWIGIQWISGIIFVPSSAIIAVEYLLWASCLACLGAQISRIAGLQALVKVVAWGLLIGGIANAASALIQYRHIAVSPYFVFPSINGRIYGNLGQSNHLTAQLWLAVGAAVYLHLTQRLHVVLLMAFSALLMLAAASTQSRSIILYAPLLAVLAWPNREARKLALLLPLMQACLLLLLPYLAPSAPSMLSPSSAQNPTVERLGGSLPDVRWELWRDAWNMFVDHPWLGVGTGNYARFSVEYSAAKLTGFPIPAEHSHNFFLQLLAQFGFPMALIIVVLIVIFLRDNIGQLIHTGKPEIFFVTAILAVIGVHSQLEYPLWYTYFLGLAMIFSGAIDARSRQIRLEKRKTMLAMTLLVGAAFLGPLKHDELKIEKALQWPINGHSPALAFEEAIKHIEGISTESLLSPYGQIVLTTSIAPNSAVAASHWKVCESVLKFAPTSDLLAKCTESAHLLGRKEEAHLLEEQRKRAWLARTR